MKKECPIYDAFKRFFEDETIPKVGTGILAVTQR
jgi:hypothetical protein